MEFYLRKDTYSRAVMQASVRQETFFCVSLDCLTISPISSTIYYLTLLESIIYYLLPFTFYFLPYNLC